MMAKAKRPLARHSKKLIEKEPRFVELIERFGHCSITPEPDRFASMVRAIIAQQISYKAALTISRRLDEKCGKGGVTLDHMLSLSDETLRSCGLSGPKIRTIRNLLAHLEVNPDYLSMVDDISDDELGGHLTVVKGIGPWTAHMIAIFSLARPDIWPVGDLGLKAGIRDFYQMKEMPTLEEMLELGERFRPYRSIATWYFWRIRGDVPQYLPD
jgi:DNA-3-methyladenine glycosylase II